MQDLGHLGDTACAQDILNGTYIFPPDTNEWTIKILQEAHHLWMLLNNKPISTSISIAGLKGYWGQVNEKISSSYSRLHFGHYKAASFSKDLLALHAVKLMACSRKGLPLQRWGVGLMVLLEKIHGNNHIHKMHAIILF
jgi:hypothetical protein